MGRRGAAGAPGAAGIPGDGEMVRLIWPCLAAAALGLVPFTIFSNFLVAIAEDAQAEPALLGSLRGLGGVAALAISVACAPLLDRASRRRIAAVSLAGLALACAVGAVGQTWSWVLFCLAVGGATATLNPALSAMASDTFPDAAAAGRAATLVSSTMTLTAVLSAPVLALPAALWGWRGDLLAVAALCLTAALLLRRGEDVGAGERRPSGYLASFRIAARVPAALPLLGASAARTAAFMGQLAFVAVYYSETFGVGPKTFSLVWSLSGISFFLGNWFGGRQLQDVRSPRRILGVTAIASLAGTATVAALFTVPSLPVALAMTSLTAAAHAIVAAGVTTLLVRGSGPARGTVLSLNGACQSAGVCGGATLAGAGLSLAGWSGAAAALAGVTALAAVLCALAWRGAAKGAEP